MKRSIRSIRLISKYFHNINLSASWPLPIQIFICRHHPECRQKPLPFRNLKLRFKQPVFKIMLILRIDPAGRIRHCSIRSLCFNRFDYKLAIFDINIFRRIRILLQLVVNPSRLMCFNIPVFHLQGITVKRFLPDQIVSVIDIVSAIAFYRHICLLFPCFCQTFDLYLNFCCSSRYRGHFSALYCNNVRIRRAPYHRKLFVSVLFHRKLFGLPYL